MAKRAKFKVGQVVVEKSNDRPAKVIGHQRGAYPKENGGEYWCGVLQTSKREITFARNETDLRRLNEREIGPREARKK
jgi:hypothetical protein